MFGIDLTNCWLRVFYVHINMNNADYYSALFRLLYIVFCLERFSVIVPHCDIVINLFNEMLDSNQSI